MKTNLRERLTRYQCVNRPKVHFASDFSFKSTEQNDSKKLGLCDFSAFLSFKAVSFHSSLKAQT